MRSTPLSTDISNASDLKTLNTLSEEIVLLLTKLMSTDKRSIRNTTDKLKFKAKLDSCISLYKTCREKFIMIERRNGLSTYYHQPIAFEDFVKRQNWIKSVKFSNNINTVTTIMDALKDIDKNSEVIEYALTKSLPDFKSHYKALGSEISLEKLYHSIRSTKVFSIIKSKDFIEYQEPQQEVSSPEVGVSSLEKKIFKSLPINERIQIVESYREKLGSEFKTGTIKKELEREYIINHYDDVYLVFVKITKKN